MRFLKVLALFIAASVGLWIGDHIGPVPNLFDWDMWLEYRISSIVRQKHYFLAGVSVSALVLLCSRALRFHDVAALITVFLFSFLYPVSDLVSVGDPPSLHWLPAIWAYQAPYFFGFLAVMGIAYALDIWVRPLIRKRAS